MDPREERQRKKERERSLVVGGWSLPDGGKITNNKHHQRYPLPYLDTTEYTLTGSSSVNISSQPSKPKRSPPASLLLFFSRFEAHTGISSRAFLVSAIDQPQVSS
jgi:hypothetical protein